MISTIGVATVPVGRVDVQIDVGVYPQAAFLHVAVRDVQIGQQQLQLGQIRFGLFGRADIRVADDLQQRRARAIQVDAAVRLAGRFIVHTLAGVIFQVSADDADSPRLRKRPLDR